MIENNLQPVISLQKRVKQHSLMPGPCRALDYLLSSLNEKILKPGDGNGFFVIGYHLDHAGGARALMRH